jgi:hypothetical protein
MHSLYLTKQTHIESEYKLVDPERLKQDLRTSRTTPNPNLAENLSPKFNHTSLIWPESIDNSVELPVSHSPNLSELKK